MNRNILAPLTALFGMTDEQAMWRVQTTDDSHAFNLLVQRWRLPIERMCARMLASADRGQDLAQETFVRLYAKRQDYRTEGAFSSYIWRIAMNLCYDELRRVRRRRETSLDDLCHDDSPHLDSTDSLSELPSDRIDQEERATRVRTALVRVPEIYRAVIVLRHFEGLKFREIASVLEIPEGTVKSRMAEGLALLARILRSRESGEIDEMDQNPKLILL